MTSILAPHIIIQNKLTANENNIEFKGYSNIGTLMQEFNSKDKSNDLFSFLIENNMNKYIFGLLLRLGTLDINNIPFREELLDPQTLEERNNESFVKKFECKTCNHLIFRKHIHEIDDYIDNDYYCPICDRDYKLEYNNLKDDYNLTRNDLFKYLDRLCDINIVEKKSVYSCNKCIEYEDYDNQNNLECENCGSDREVVHKYFFKDDFLKTNLKNRDGSWFEWYVFKICEHIFEHADHNLMLSYDNSGFEDECEIDVISIKDNELFIFECKDHLKGKLGLNHLQSLPKLSAIFEKVYLVSSNKEVSSKNKQYINNLCVNEIEFIAGISLEKQFLSEDKVLEMFNDRNKYKAITLYKKLNEIKRKNIAKKIISKNIDLDCKNEDNLHSLNLILGHNNEIRDRVDSEDIKTILEYCIQNILTETIEIESLKYVSRLLRTSPETVLDNVSLNTIFKMGITHLTPLKPYVRSEFMNFYWIFNNMDIDVNLIDEDVAIAFLKLVIPLLGVYFGNYPRKSNLKIIETLWQFADETCQYKLISTVKSILWQKQEHGYINKMMLIDFLVENFSSFTSPNRVIIGEMFNDYINLKDIPENYIYNEVKQALEEIKP